MRHPAKLSRVARAIRLLRQNEPPEGYSGCNSGGRDSIAIVRLAELAKVKVRWHYNITTLDPPEVLYFLRKHHPNTRWQRTRKGNLWTRAVEKGVIPTRAARWCCDEYKHYPAPKDSTLLMGIRHEESVARQQWREVDWFRKSPRSRVVLPILRWDSEYLWDFIREEKLPYCELYDRGFARIGCIGCPLADRSSRRFEFDLYPKYEAGWRRALDRIWAKKQGTKQRDGREWFGSALFDHPDDMWDWWVKGKSLPKHEDAFFGL